MPSRPKNNGTHARSKDVTRPSAGKQKESSFVADVEGEIFRGGQQQKWEMPLRFVNFDHPSQTNARQYRKEIRSHVTRLQHKQKRSKTNRVSDLERLKQSADDEDPTRAYPTPTSTFTQIPAASEEVRDEGGVYEKSKLNPQVAMSRVDPFRAHDAAADWTIEIPALIDQYLSRARGYMRSHGMEEESRVLHSRLVRPRLYLDGFLFNALITLTTTRVAVVNQQRRCEPLVAWLRNNFLLTIRAAIQAGFDDPKALAVGIALLIGWELDVGDPDTCEVHLKALPSVISAGETDHPKSTFEYRDVGRVVSFRSGPQIPPGFDFYRSQNLLPSSLMFHVGSLVYYDASAPGSSLWMRELWSSIGACAPVEETASKSVSARTLSARVAQLVRQAGIMVGSFMRLSAGEQPVAQPLRTGIQALWHATLSADWKLLIGTVYDGIVLWCLCVFCTTSGYRDKHHMDAISRLLLKLDIGSLSGLIALLGTFLCPDCLYGSLTDLWRWLDRQQEDIDQPNRARYP